ncbi:MAG: hypothetical protein EBS39_12270, partial [Gammaproteobacteria bacterium]|nr:hypothetical protein [Gammaproteobacteria bacterium]
MARYRSKAWRAFRPESSGVDASPTPASPAPAAPQASCRILGLDPGSRLTGWGVIAVDGADCRCLAQGRIEVGTLP